jgi:hypothetical protein
MHHDQAGQGHAGHDLSWVSGNHRLHAADRRQHHKPDWHAQAPVGWAQGKRMRTRCATVRTAAASLACLATRPGYTGQAILARCGQTLAPISDDLSGADSSRQAGAHSPDDRRPGGGPAGKAGPAAQTAPARPPWRPGGVAVRCPGDSHVDACPSRPAVNVLPHEMTAGRAVHDAEPATKPGARRRSHIGAGTAAGAGKDGT